MGYLFTQILIWLLLAAALGVLMGWLLWGRRDELEKCQRDSRNLRYDLERARAELKECQSKEQSAGPADDTVNAELQAAKAETQSLRAEVELARNALKANRDERENARSAVESETSGIRAELEKAKANLDTCRGDLQQAQSELADCRASQAATPTSDTAGVTETQTLISTSAGTGPNTEEVPPEDWKPNLLSSPQGEKDDLKRIRGVGPKIEGILNDLGIYHFNQIAAFTEENVAWVNEHLMFKGRIERENWIEQAKQLASGGETDFSKRYNAEDQD